METSDSHPNEYELKYNLMPTNGSLSFCDYDDMSEDKYINDRSNKSGKWTKEEVKYILIITHN
jgi:hypothetical protein